jgi:chromosome segregation ATPase
MTLKEIWTETSNWLRSHKFTKVEYSQPNVDEEGLITQDEESEEPKTTDSQQFQGQGDKVLAKQVQPMDKRDSIEKLQQGFDKLIEQLQNINEHLNRQIAQHEELTSRIEKLPDLLESFPTIMQNQKQTAEELLEQSKTTAARQQQFIEAVERIPNETSKQTDALVNIDHQLAAAADTDVQMAESFNKFNETLDKLNQSTLGQTDSIMQMSKTFAASDRYLKYIISRQNKRFMWIFATAIGVCVAVILILTGIIIYLRQ